MNLRKLWLPLAFLVALCVGGQAQIEPVRDATAGAIIKEVTFLPAAERQDAGDSGTPIDVGAYAEGVIYIGVTGKKGTFVAITISFDSCSSPAPADCFTHTEKSETLTIGWEKLLLPVNNFGRYVRIRYSLGGIATFSVKGTFKAYR